MRIPKHPEPPATFEDLLLTNVLLRSDVIAAVRLIEELAYSMGVNKIEGLDVVDRFELNRIEAIQEAFERARSSDPALAERLQEYLPDD